MGNELEQLQAAVRNVYFAAKWTTDAIPEDKQRKLWENLRDAADIPVGSATNEGVGAD